jgi:hypothetical protein
MEDDQMPTTQSSSDFDSVRVLTAFALAHRDRPDLVLEPGVEVLEALRAEFGGSTMSDAPVTQAELVRTALDLVGRDEAYGPEIQALASGPTPERMAFVETAAVLTAVLIVLQTYVRFERRPGGKWSFIVEKKPTNSALLGKLVSKLVGFVGK